MLSAWIVGFLGIWTVIVPFVPMAQLGDSWNNWIVGVIAAVLGFSLSGEHNWQRPIVVIVGLWLLVSGFLPALMTGGALVANNVLAGALLIVAGFISTRRHVVMAPPHGAQ